MSVIRSLTLWWKTGKRSLVRKNAAAGALLSSIAFVVFLGVSYKVVAGPKALFEFLSSGMTVIAAVLGGGIYYFRRRKSGRQATRVENGYFLALCAFNVVSLLAYIMWHDHVMAVLVLAIAAWVVMCFIAYIIINVRKNWLKTSDVDNFLFPIILFIGSLTVFVFVASIPRHWVELMQYRLFI